MRGTKKRTQKNLLSTKGMTPSILVVDDEPHFCTSLRVLLEAHGYSIETANTGQEALFHINNNRFEAVILDIGLPDISGSEIAAHLGQHYPDTAVIVLTGIATVETAVTALRQGVYDFLHKPFDLDQMLRTVARGIEHKQLERQLRSSEKRFRQLAQATWEGIMIYEQGKLLESNDHLCLMFGYEAQELQGLQIFGTLLDKHSLKPLQSALTSDHVGPFEGNGVRKDGSLFPIEIRVKRITYDGRKVQVAAIRDVTGSKEAVKRQLALQKKLADAKRMESLGLMAGSVAHDLNNIMAGILTYPDLLLLDLREDFKYRNEIKMIRDAGRRAAAIVNDLLTVARGATCKKTVANVNSIISDYLHSAEYHDLRRRFPEITISKKLDKQLHNVHCSAVHIAKIMMNLVNNAAEAIDGKGTISINSRHAYLVEAYEGYERIEPGEYCVISIQDNGPGIPEEDIGRVFDPFFSKKCVGRSGTGLGLAIVWNTIHDHDGHIDITSNEEGTTFTLYFPATQSKLNTAENILSLNACIGNGENILVVDDQKSQREIASRLLARLGYNPYTAKSGEEAVEFIKKQRVDLVMLDMIMDPGMSGCETYLQIIEHFPGQKAVIVSGCSDSDEIQSARELGISQVIKKPYSLHDLGQALKLGIS